jgi:beta-glucanase (GH16 family)
MMRRHPYQLLLVALTLGWSGSADAQHAASSQALRWKLVWSDEFDGVALDKTKWDFDTGNGFYNQAAKVWVSGWGNEELQYYTSRPKNAFVRDGALHIRALKEVYQGCGFTSARLKSRKQGGHPLFIKKYGRFEFRAQLPTGKGLWPAIWMLPQDEKYGGWAASGEIDIVEAKGQEPDRVLGTLHFGSRWPGNTHAGRQHVLPSGSSIAEFHIYALEWEPGEIRWYVDANLYATQTFWWSGSKRRGIEGVKPVGESDLHPWPAPFDQPFYLVMNVAVGGKFPGNPDQVTRFPAEMVIDYVRVYDKVGGYGPPKARGVGVIPFAKPKRGK